MVYLQSIKTTCCNYCSTKIQQNDSTNEHMQILQYAWLLWMCWSPTVERLPEKNTSKSDKTIVTQIVEQRIVKRGPTINYTHFWCIVVVQRNLRTTTYLYRKTFGRFNFLLKKNAFTSKGFYLLGMNARMFPSLIFFFSFLIYFYFNGKIF